ncbi:MAG: hypothetical protein ACOX0A_07150 [Thermoguttaceae bacterium]|jgi:hypothetical protein
MFDVNEFMNAPIYDETTIVRRGTEEFRIRRLNGAERLRFNDLEARYDRVRYALGRGLLSGAEPRPIGDENAARMIERYGALAEALFSDIFEFTERSLEKELEIWDEAQKNSSRARDSDTRGSCADSADATA